MSRLLWPELDPYDEGKGWIAAMPELKVTSAQVLDAIATRHPMDGFGGKPGRWVFVREVQAETGQYSDTQRFDAVAIGLVPSVKYARVVYEVKVSRSDWLRELRPVYWWHWHARFMRRVTAEQAAAIRAEAGTGDVITEGRKWDLALAMSTEFWVAAPPFVVRPEELPPEAGLVEVRPWGPSRELRPKVVVKAPVRETPVPGQEFWASVLREAAARRAEVAA